MTHYKKSTFAKKAIVYTGIAAVLCFGGFSAKKYTENNNVNNTNNKSRLQELLSNEEITWNEFSKNDRKLLLSKGLDENSYIDYMEGRLNYNPETDKFSPTSQSPTVSKLETYATKNGSEYQVVIYDDKSYSLYEKKANAFSFSYKGEGLDYTSFSAGNKQINLQEAMKSISGDPNVKSEIINNPSPEILSEKVGAAFTMATLFSTSP